MTDRLTDAMLLDYLFGRQSFGDLSDAQLKPLPSSYTHRFWRLEVRDRIFVIKEYFPGLENNPLYPTQPDQEAAALSVLEPFHLAPRLESFLTSPVGTPLVVYGYEPGKEAEIDVRDAALLVGQLSALKLTPSSQKTVPAGYSQVLAHGDDILAEIPDSRRAANLKRLRPVDGAATEHAIDPVLIHRSLCLGTVQTTRDGPKLIDWQYAGLGDPVEDLVCFLSPGLLTLYGLKPLVLYAEDLFLDHYPDQLIVDRFLEQRAAYHWRLAAYCLYRHETLVHSNAPAARACGKALEEEVDLLLRLRGK
ncbi:MAG: phosphotransferase [Roseibium sp.]